MELNTAKWSRLPDLNGSASHSFNFGRSLQADNTYQSINTQNTGLNLTTSVPLFTGMQIPHSISLAKLNLKAAIEDLNKAKEDISIQVASAYLQVLFNEELAKVAHQQVSLSQEMLKQKEAYYQNGKASEAEWRESAVACGTRPTVCRSGRQQLPTGPTRSQSVAGTAFSGSDLPQSFHLK